MVRRGGVIELVEVRVVDGIRRALLSYPYNIATTTSPELALQMLRREHFDVIVVFADTGVAQLKVMREALNAGVAVVPFSTGDAPFGEIGKDYLTRVTETQIGFE